MFWQGTRAGVDHFANDLAISRRDFPASHVRLRGRRGGFVKPLQPSPTVGDGGTPSFGLRRNSADDSTTDKSDFLTARRIWQFPAQTEDSNVLELSSLQIK